MKNPNPRSCHAKLGRRGVKGGVRCAGGEEALSDRLRMSVRVQGEDPCVASGSVFVLQTHCPAGTST